jgi:hypothetical protein
VRCKPKNADQKIDHVSNGSLKIEWPSLGQAVHPGENGGGGFVPKKKYMFYLQQSKGINLISFKAF